MERLEDVFISGMENEKNFSRSSKNKSSFSGTGEYFKLCKVS